MTMNDWLITNTQPGDRRRRFGADDRADKGRIERIDALIATVRDQRIVFDPSMQ
jgi:hypothetical protein